MNDVKKLRSVTVVEYDDGVRITFNDKSDVFTIPNPKGRALLEGVARKCVSEWLTEACEQWASNKRLHEMDPAVRGILPIDK
jgi:hypothetical protein